MLRAGGGVSVIMVVVSRSPRRREGDAIAAKSSDSASTSRREVVLSYGPSFQQAQQQATVTGMGLGDGAGGAYEATIVVLAPASTEALFLSPRRSRRFSWTVVIVVL